MFESLRKYLRPVPTGVMASTARLDASYLRFMHEVKSLEQTCKTLTGDSSKNKKERK